VTTTTDTTPAEAPVVDGDASGDDDELVVDDEVLLEEISIDGMCGVY
jgi:mycofactocin precursor